jgi:hypothetical protein
MVPPLPEMPLLPITSEQTVAACRALNVTDSDIFICSYPKSGTTWTQNLVCRLLAANLSMELADDWHLSQSAPFYEVDQYWNTTTTTTTSSRVPAKTPLQNATNEYRVFNTHLRPHQLPPKAKCIYVMRDPLDVLASFYYHLANMAEADGGYTGTAEDFSAAFLDGTVLYGKWQDHMETWLGTNVDDDDDDNDGQAPKILFLHYQDMKTNLKTEAIKLSRFLGVNEARVESVMETALPHCTFSAMRHERWRYTPRSVQWKTDETTGKPYDDFVRAGRIGDGKTFMTTLGSSITEDDDDDLKKQWQQDLEVAKDRWHQAGVDPDIIARYLATV